MESRCQLAESNLADPYGVPEAGRGGILGGLRTKFPKKLAFVTIIDSKISDL